MAKVSQRHLATVVCGLRGHVTPAAGAVSLEGPLLLGVDVDLDGPASGAGAEPAGGAPVRLARCLRCDAWCRHPQPGGEGAGTLPSPEELHLPRRDKALRSAVVLRIIAVERAIHCVGFTIVAVLAFLLRVELAGVQSWVRRLLHQLTAGSGGTGDNFGGSIITREGNHLLHLKQSTLTVVILIALAYAVVEGVEAVGLWRERRWAEYLTVVATVGFIPYEVLELTKSVSALKIGALVANVIILLYLLWSKELFGIGRLRDRRRPPAPDPLEPFRRPSADRSTAAPTR